jgi:hypothetical protein
MCDHNSLFNYSWFYDQEPLDERNLNNIEIYSKLSFSAANCFSYFEPTLRILANSEHSKEKDKFLNYFVYSDWYYFFHGFAALDWFRNFKYVPPIRSYSQVFITFNHLCTEKRSYRLNLISRVLDRGLRSHGAISLGQTDIQSKIRQEIFNPHSLLSRDSKKLILENLFKKDLSDLVIDTAYCHGALSAAGNLDDLDTMCRGLFHVVTETVFYDQKLHLTEKIFKPIVSRRPFLLAGAPGNLAYLKSYGFRTFDQWIDESYDLESDPDQRLIMIVDQIEKLCKLDPTELERLYQEMQDTLDYNFEWFYGGFKQVIVDELVDNFRSCVIHHNRGRSPVADGYINLDQVDFSAIKKRLAQ